MPRSNHFNNYWVIWMVNVAIVALAVTVWGPSWPAIARIAFFEVIFGVSFYVKVTRDSPRISEVIINTDERLTIKGVFKKMDIEKAAVVSFSVSRDLLARVFDWSKITIITKNGKTIIYTRHLVLPTDRVGHGR